ncbi:MAG TPA: hypothetical protein VH854_14055, partial [Thermoanaerobaculia bacterium]|nr:hypothetical protein [Thermoanaerobaculia bacterium]
MLALLPLALTGRAVLFGELYGPADLYETADPWKSFAESRHEAIAVHNPILSDLAFANLPWRAAVREALVNGRAPLWNRFVLCGTPLLGAAQAGVLHPSTWLGIWLPLPLSWTFSCAFTLFLGFLTAYLFFADFGVGAAPPSPSGSRPLAAAEREARLPAAAALVGAAAWGLSTYVVFWNGWSVGPSTATLPLLLLGLRRLARGPDRRGVAITAAALWLSLCGGHPESFFHGAAAAGVYFVWELWPRRGGGGRAARSIAAAAGASLLALALAGPQLLPLLEAIPRSAEYRARRTALASAAAPGQSVSADEAARRLLPDLLPFAHGIYGRSPVDPSRPDGSGMPLGYAGAVLFPLAFVALAAPRRRMLSGSSASPERPRGRAIFAVFAAAGLLYGASAPGLMHATERLPGFALALNYRLVFLAGLGLAGLAALGASEVAASAAARRRLAVASGACAILILVAALLARPVYAERGLSRSFVLPQLAYETVPLVLLAVAAASVRSPRIRDAALVLLVGQRILEMRGTYPTLPAGSLAPPLPTLAALPVGYDPGRVAAPDGVLRPNAAALYRLEDARGYESLVLDRFADTFPLWCRLQPASFNRIDDLAAPFLSALNVRWAIAAPGADPPRGWAEQARGPEMAIFENPAALPRAWVPSRLRRVADPARRLDEMRAATGFGEAAWLSTGDGPAEEANGPAHLSLRTVGTDLIVVADASGRTLVATSI